MSEKTERVLQLARNIFDLEARIQLARRELSRLVGETNTVIAAPVAEEAVAEQSIPTSLTARIATLLHQDQAKKWPATEIIAALDEHDPRAIRSELSRLHRNGRIRRHGRGLYAAT